MSETARFDCNFNYSQAKTFQNQLSYPTSQRVEQIRYSCSGAFFDSGGVFFLQESFRKGTLEFIRPHPKSLFNAPDSFGLTNLVGLRYLNDFKFRHNFVIYQVRHINTAEATETKALSPPQLNFHAWKATLPAKYWKSYLKP